MSVTYLFWMTSLGPGPVACQLFHAYKTQRQDDPRCGDPEMGMVVVVLKMVRGDGWGRRTFEERKFITFNFQSRAWKYDIFQNDQGVTPELAVLFLNCSFFYDCTIYCLRHVTFVLLVRVWIESICTGNSSLGRLFRHVFFCPIAYTKFACKSDWSKYTPGKCISI